MKILRSSWNLDIRNLVFLFMVLLSSTAMAFGPQSSNKNLIWGFDFVEEFDGLQDWNQTSCPGCGDRADAFPEHVAGMPKLENGSTSAWGYYSNWSSSTQTSHPWIGGTTGGRQVWRGTKSLSIDHGSSAYGPSRLGIFTTEGYDSVSFFYMLYLPRNLFPTRCYWPADPGVTVGCNSTGQLGGYVDGQPYVYFPFFKLNDTVMGCTATWCPDYGLWAIINNIERRADAYPPGGLGMLVAAEGAPLMEAANGGAASRIDNLMGDWFGLEIKNELINGKTQNRQNIWIYDRNGNQQHVLVDRVTAISSAAQSADWNMWVLGGNKSFGDGVGLVGHHYIDDVIIDDGSKGQIGPRYFAAIAQDNVPVSKPNAATNFSYTTRSRDAVVAGGATRGNLTQCPDGKWATVCKATVYDVRVNCTNPSTRENGNSFLPAGIESLDWIFEPTGNGKTHSVKVPRCPFLVDLPPATYTVKQRTVLTHSGDGKVGNWSQISGSMEVPAP